MSVSPINWKEMSNGQLLSKKGDKPRTTTECELHLNTQKGGQTSYQHWRCSTLPVVHHPPRVISKNWCLWLSPHTFYIPTMSVSPIHWKEMSNGQLLSKKGTNLRPAQKTFNSNQPKPLSTDTFTSHTQMSEPIKSWKTNNKPMSTRDCLLIFELTVSIIKL